MSSAIESPTTEPTGETPGGLPPEHAAWLAYQALDQSDDIVLLLEAGTTPDAVVIAVNGAFRRASGFTDRQLLGCPIAALFPARDQAAALTKAIRDGTTLRAEFACRRAAAGKTFSFGLHLMRAPERTPGRKCFTILGRDITAQLEARQMGDAIHRLLAKVFMSVDDAVVIISAVGRVLMANARIDRLLGYQPNELVGRRSLDLVAPEARDAITATIKHQMETGADQSYIAPLLKADDTIVVAAITSALVATEDGKKFRILTLRPHGIRTETAARIRLVGMEDARAGLDDRWASVAKRAMTTAEDVVRRHRGDEDSFCQVDDTTFLLCFGALNEKEAKFRAATIAREVRERLIAQGGDPGTSTVQAIAASVRFPDRAGLVPVLTANLLTALEGQLERLRREARQTLADAEANASCELKRIAGRGTGETAAFQTALPAEFEHAVLSALSILPVEEAKAFDLDGLLLGCAARHAAETTTQGETVPYLVRVRFDVFASRQATERFLGVCARIDRNVAGRLILLLSSLPPGVPRTRQLECIIRLRPFCRGVGYHLDGVDDLAEIELSYNADPIVSLPASVLATEDPERLQSTIGLLHARRARVLFREVASADDAAAFRALGADMVSM